MLKKNIAPTALFVGVFILLQSPDIWGVTYVDYAFYHPSECIAESMHVDPVKVASQYLQYEGSSSQQFYCPIHTSTRYQANINFRMRGDTVDYGLFWVYDNGSSGNIFASLCCLDWNSVAIYCGSNDSTSCDGCYDQLYLPKSSYCNSDDALFISVTMPSNAGGSSRLHVYHVYAAY